MATNMATATATELPSSGRMPRKELTRVGILMGSALLVFEIVRSGLANSLTDTNPLMAVGADPGSAKASAAAARALVEQSQRPSSSAVRVLVRNALRRDATLTLAIELRALDMDSAGDTQGAARLFSLSRMISRRSLGTHTWLIQHAVKRGDVAEALAEYDLALRTSTAAPRLLFPVLAKAAANPELASPIAQTLDRPSDWREMFLDYAIARPGSVQRIVALFLKMRDRSFLKDKQIDRLLIGQLVKDGSFGPAERVELAFGPPIAKGSLVRDPGFSEAQFHFPFGWTLIEAADVWAQRDRASGLAYHGASGGAGQIATQLLTLAPGSYRLVARNAEPAADTAALPYWTVTCAGAQPRQIALLNQSAGAGAMGDFAVPSGCGGQWLALNLRASDRAEGQSGAIRSVTIQPR